MNDLKISASGNSSHGGHSAKYERNGHGMYLSLAGRTHAEFQSGLRAKSLVRLHLGEGGTLLTLVMRLERCDSREAIRRLQNGEKGRRFRFSFTGWRASSCRRSLAGLVRPPFRAPHPLRRFAPASGIGRLSRLARHRPAGRRGILPRGPLRDKRPRLFAVGFRNDAGGWELRSRAVQRRLLAHISPPSTTVPIR